MGLGLLILGLVLWAIGAAVPVPVLARVGIVVGIVGFVLLLLRVIGVFHTGAYA